MLRLLLLFSLVALLCACSGTMHGQVRGTGERVQMSYQQEMNSDKLSVTMPDGEVFTGKAVPAGDSSVSNFFFGDFKTFSGNYQAVLFGSRGGSMRCNLKYADPKGQTEYGGVGTCETDKGKSIDIKW